MHPQTACRGLATTIPWAVLFDGKTEVGVEELLRASKEAGYEAQLY